MAKYTDVFSIDSDYALEPNVPLATDGMSRNKLYYCYTIRFVRPNCTKGNNLTQQAQDLEYKMNGL